MNYSVYFREKRVSYKPGYNCTVDGFRDPDTKYNVRTYSLNLLFSGSPYGFASGRAYMNFIDLQYYKKYNKNILRILNTNNRTFLKKENIKAIITDINNLLDIFISFRPDFRINHMEYISYEGIFRDESKEDISEFGKNVYCYNYKNYDIKSHSRRYSEKGYLKKCFNILTDYVFNENIDITKSNRKYAIKIYRKLIDYMSNYAIDAYNELLKYVHLSNANPIKADFRNPVFLNVLQFAGNNMIDEVVFENKSIKEVCYNYQIGIRKFKNMVVRECRHHVFELINDDKLTIDDIRNKFKLSDKLFLKFAINI